MVFFIKWIFSSNWIDFGFTIPLLLLRGSFILILIILTQLYLFIYFQSLFRLFTIFLLSPLLYFFVILKSTPFANTIYIFRRIYVTFVNTLYTQFLFFRSLYYSYLLFLNKITTSPLRRRYLAIITFLISMVLFIP